MTSPMQHRWVRHGLFWAVVLLLNFLMQLPAHFAVGTKLYLWGLVFNQLPASVLSVYPLLYWVLPRLLRRQLLLFAGLLLGWGAAALVLTGLTRAFFEFIVRPGLLNETPAGAFSWREYFDLSGYTWFTMLVTAGAACATKVLNEWHQLRKVQEQLLRRRLQAELQLLKAQLQPTFLFGTLHTLRQLTAQKATEAPGAVLHLAAVLRYMLYEAPQETVPLTDEVELLQHYVALEQLRLGSRVEVSLNFSGLLSPHTVAPLLLLPLVENAFRHGTHPSLECPWISIDLVARHNTVTLKVINSRAGAAAAGEGNDLRCLRQRLASLYPGRHDLKILTEPDTFFVVLQLRLAPAAQAPVARAARLAT